MDWLELQDKARKLLDSVFRGRVLTESKIESAKSKDIGETAKGIDAVIRAISRGGKIQPDLLTEDEKDILQMRLDWAAQVATCEAQIDRRPYGQTMTEDEFEDFLIIEWQKSGRGKYNTPQWIAGLLRRSFGG